MAGKPRCSRVQRDLVHPRSLVRRVLAAVMVDVYAPEVSAPELEAGSSTSVRYLGQSHPAANYANSRGDEG